MSADKTDVNSLGRELNDDNQPIVITFDIEDIVLITNIVNAVEGLFYVCKTCPFRLLSFFVPILQRGLLQESLQK